MKNQTFISIIISTALIVLSIIVSAQCVQCDENSSATGNYSSVIGMSTIATNDGSFAGGYSSEANGALSFAFGNQVIAGATNSLVLGRFLETTASPSMIFGTGAGLSPSEKLINSISNSLMIGFNSNKSTLFVGMSDGVGYTGKVAIGDVTDPQAKLHIKADDGEAATLFIEPHYFTAGESAKLRLGTMDYGISSGYGRLFFNTGGNYIFNSTDAKVGIGTNTPTEKLEVNGNIKQPAGFYVCTDKVQAAGTSGLELYNSSGNGIFVASDGNVGLGTNSPQTRLHIEDNAGNLDAEFLRKIITSLH